MNSATLLDNKQVKQRQKLALVAGEGKLPAIMAQSAKEKGYDVMGLALSEDVLHAITPHCYKAVHIAVGQVGKNLKRVKDEGITEAVFIGRIPKINLLQNIYKFDWMAVKELSKLTNFNDDTIQMAMGDLLDRNDVRVLPQREFLQHLFPQVGVLTRRQPSVADYADINYALKMAKDIARLDIGQTVVVRDRMILAVEAIEGTDNAIKRGVSLARGPVVVAKVAKVKHDQRFDTPTIGITTLKALISGEHKGGVIAIGANETMVIDQEEIVQFADEHNICIVVVDPNKEQ